MATVSYEDLEILANILVNKIEEEFAIKHMSGNLTNTIEVLASQDKIEVVIPAQVYDMLLYQKKGVIVHTGNESYASELDKEGSSIVIYSHGKETNIALHNHKGYIDKVINDAIVEWLGSIGEKYQEAKRTDFGG